MLREAACDDGLSKSPACGFKAMGKISSLNSYPFKGNPRCRSAFKRHETDQAFQQDAEQTATTRTQKEAS
jgi:hypothetical protein